MSGQPEALRLADELEGDYDPDWMYQQGVDEIAAELRRLHDVEKQRDGLLAALKNTAEALAHCMGNEYAPVVEARAAILKATGGQP